MIDLQIENERSIGTSDALAIVNMATQLAEINGAVSSFLYERALLMLLAQVLYPEKNISEALCDDFGGTWDDLIEDGTIEKLNTEYGLDVEFLNSMAASWYDEYISFSQSARGVIDFVQSLAGDTFSKAKDQLQQVMDSQEIAETLNIANNWGMNNGISAPDDDNLFVFQGGVGK